MCVAQWTLSSVALLPPACGCFPAPEAKLQCIVGDLYVWSHCSALWGSISVRLVGGERGLLKTGQKPLWTRQPYWNRRGGAAAFREEGSASWRSAGRIISKTSFTWTHFRSRFGWFFLLTETLLSVTFDWKWSGSSLELRIDWNIDLPPSCWWNIRTHTWVNLNLRIQFKWRILNRPHNNRLYHKFYFMIVGFFSVPSVLT